MEVGAWGIHLSSLYLGSNYHPQAGHCQDHPMDGNRGPGGIGLGLLLGAPLPTAGAWGEGWGTNSDFPAVHGEAVRLKDTVPRDRG